MDTFRNTAALVANRVLRGVYFEFLNPHIVIVALISQLGGAETAVSAMVSLFTLGGLAQLFGAWYLHEDESRKRYLLRVSWISFALNLAFAAAVWFLAADLPGILLAMVLVIVFAKAVAEPAAWPALLDLERRLIPRGERAKIFSIRGFFGAGAGLAAGGATAVLLSQFSFPNNYVLVCLAAAVASVGALLCVLVIREDRHDITPGGSRPAPGEFFRTALQLLHPSNPEGGAFRRYIGVRHLVFLARCAIPFFTLYAISHFEIGEAQAATFVIALMAGKLAGSFGLAACAPARRSPHRMLTLALASLIVGLGIAGLTPWWWGLYATFFLQGIFLEGLMVSDPIFMMDNTPKRHEVLGMSLTMVALLPMSVTLPWISGAIMKHVGFMALAGLGMAAALAGIVAIRVFLPPHEPEPTTSKAGDTA